TWNVFNVGADPNSFFDIIMNPHLTDDYVSPEVSGLAADALAVSDESARADIYGELQQILVEELPIMTVQFTPIYSVAATGVDGYAVNPLGWPMLTDATVAE
ncbi:MAG TPA: hypothetical protein DEA59_00665, partial [Microbacterium sp.]|nr:hypothetical protein [Microbacterium sp.]